MNAELLKIESLTVDYSLDTGRLFGARTATLRAVDGISFTLGEGETLGIVGETGCGKSSLGKAILQLVRPTGGRALWRGRDLCALDAPSLKNLRADLQIIFQDPLSALNPRMTVGEIVAEPLRVHQPDMAAADRADAAAEMLERVGLRSEMAARYPNEFSAGQCQRISIARAMISAPKLIVCDEAVSALDVSIQAQICNLLRQLQRETGVAIIFISHDLSVVRYMAHRVLVMYLGRLMEYSDRDELFNKAKHPYSRALIDAIPAMDPDRSLFGRVAALEQDIPSALNPPSGCVFRTRCPKASQICAERLPEMQSLGNNHFVACHHWDKSGVQN